MKPCRYPRCRLILGLKKKHEMEKKLLAVALLSTFLAGPADASTDCWSDFDCGMGYICVKAPYQTRGVCMRSVDEFGVQQYDLPRLDSIFPKDDGDCNFDTDCPMGFHCDLTYKACIRN